ncbi:hypothetical protein F1880_006522, partial [Penicillium rolfsii]
FRSARDNSDWSEERKSPHDLSRLLIRLADGTDDGTGGLHPTRLIHRTALSESEITTYPIALDTMISCDYPGCTAQYRRKEHLNRHARKHYSFIQLTCEVCGKLFDRSDTLRRHHQLHRNDKPQSTPRTARDCDLCRASKIRCHGDEPCNRCLLRGLRCTLSRRPKTALVSDAAVSMVMREPALPTSNTSVDHQEHESSPGPHILNASEEIQILPPQYENCFDENFIHAPTVRNRFDEEQLDIDHYIDIYFTTFHFQWPIIHRHSFQRSMDSQPHILALSIAMIGLWVTGDKAAQSKAKNMHDKLVVLLENRKGDWELRKSFKNQLCPLITFQAIVLNTIFALVREAPPDLFERCLAMVRALTATCIAGGLFSYEGIRAQFMPSESFMFDWTWVEETQRLVLALFKVNLLYKTGILNISELKFSLPDGGYLWNAAETSEFSRRYRAQAERGTSETPLICDIFRDIQRGEQGLGLLLPVDSWLGFLTSEIA